MHNENQLKITAERGSDWPHWNNKTPIYGSEWTYQFSEKEDVARRKFSAVCDSRTVRVLGIRLGFLLRLLTIWLVFRFL